MFVSPVIRQLTSASFIIATGFALTSCGGGGSTKRHAEVNPQVYKLGDDVPEGGGVNKVGKPYQIKGRWYHPKAEVPAKQVGVASWYGEYFHGRKTANGEWYDMERLSAAHPTLPLPSYVRVTNLYNRRSVVVRVNDRGPYASDRVIDMSHAAADELGFVRKGTTRVSIKYIGKAPLDGDGSDMQYVDGGPNVGRPYNTASTKKSGKGKLNAPSPRKKLLTKSDLADSAPKPETKSSPLADELLANDLLPKKLRPMKRPETTASTAPVAAKPHAKKSGFFNWLLPETTSSIAQPKSLKTSGLTPKGKYYIQAASFRNQERAGSLRDELAHLGGLDLLPVDIGTDTFYRVRFGPFPTRDAAKKAQEELSEHGHGDARIYSK